MSNWHSPQKLKVALEEQNEEEMLKAKRRLKQEKILRRFSIMLAPDHFDSQNTDERVPGFRLRSPCNPNQIEGQQVCWTQLTPNSKESFFDASPKQETRFFATLTRYGEQCFTGDSKAESNRSCLL